jgi:WD40 repeat protein/tRNA A-37 threonylcarbamoyl transferase component Bud32
MAPADNRYELHVGNSTDGDLATDETELSPALRLDVVKGPMGAYQRAAIHAALFGEKAVSVGRFRLLERLGAGGMGTAYAAYDEQLDRKIALKLIHPRAGDSQLRERTLREARALARLSHPNVVHVYEAGEVEGQLFVAMEFLAGPTLRDWLDAEARSWREIIGVFCEAGRALEVAHASGIVHRDFKPHNAMFSVDGRVRVLDFGLARLEELTGGQEHASDARAHDGAVAEHWVGSLTATGTIMGTPAYMAPEQFRGESVDPRSDQFSFCVALWEALYMRRPFAAAKFRELAEEVNAGRILAPPSATQVPARIRQALERGLAVEPDQRWPSMAELVNVLEDTPRRRRRWMSIIVMVAMLLTLAGLAIAAARSTSRLHAFEAQREVEQIRELTRSSAARLAEGRTPEALSLAIQAAARVEDEAVSSEQREQVMEALLDASAAPLEWVIVDEIPMSSRSGLIMVAPDGRRVASRHFEPVWDNALLWGANADLVAGLAAGPSVWLPGGEEFVVRVRELDEDPGRTVPLRGLDCLPWEMRFSPDSARLWARCPKGQLRLWNVESGATLLELHDSAAVVASDLRTIAAWENDAITLWDGVAGTRRARLDGHTRAPTVFAFSPDGHQVASADAFEVRVWDVDVGSELARFEHAQVKALVFHPGRTGRLSSVDAHQEVRTWSVASAERLSTLKPQGERHAEFEGRLLHEFEVSPDGRRLALYVDRHLWLWDAQTGELLLDEVDWGKPALATDDPFGSSLTRPDPLVFAPSGARLLVRLHDNYAALYDSEQGVAIGRLSACLSCSFSPDGASIVVTNKKLELWNARTGVRTLSLEHDDLPSATFAPDGETLIVGHGTTMVLRRSLADSSMITRVQLDADPDAGVVFSADGERVMVADEKHVRIYDAASGRELSVLTDDRAPITVLAGFPGAPPPLELLTVNLEGSVSAWSLDGERPPTLIVPHNFPVRRLAVAAEVGVIASAADNGSVRTWTIGTLGPELISDSEAASALFLSTDGQVLLTSHGPRVLVWDPRSGELLHEWTAPAELEALALAPDGSCVATRNAGMEVRVWDLDGTLRLQLDDGLGRGGLAFAPDVSRLATASRLFALPSGTRVAELNSDEPGSFLRGPVSFSPHGALMSANGNVWRADTGAWISASWGLTDPDSLAFSPDGSRLAALDRKTLVIRDPRPPLTVACARLAPITKAYAEVAEICVVPAHSRE